MSVGQHRDLLTPSLIKPPPAMNAQEATHQSRAQQWKQLDTIFNHDSHQACHVAKKAYPQKHQQAKK